MPVAPGAELYWLPGDAGSLRLSASDEIPMPNQRTEGVVDGGYEALRADRAEIRRLNPPGCHVRDAVRLLSEAITRHRTAPSARRSLRRPAGRAPRRRSPGCRQSGRSWRRSSWPRSKDRRRPRCSRSAAAASTALAVSASWMARLTVRSMSPMLISSGKERVSPSV